MSDPPRTYTHPEILAVVRGVALCILLAALDQTIIVPAVPRMARALGGGHQISWIVAAYLLTGTAATPIFGKLSDIYGRRRLLRPALIVFVAASLGCALAQNFGQMILLRAVQGIGGAGLMTIAQTAIADVAPPRTRGRYQLYMSGMWGIASIAGPFAGGTLTDFGSWRAIFWINLPLGVLAFFMSEKALRMLPPHAPAGQKIDYTGAVLLTASITILLYMISGIGRDFAWISAATLWLLLACLAATGLTIWQESRAAAPMLPLRLFTNGTILGGLLLSGTNSLCMFGATFLLPLYFQYVRHTNAAESGLFSTPFMLAFVVMSYAGGQISRYLGRTRLTMLIALAACFIGLALLASMGARTPVALSILYMVVLGSGIGLVQPNITVAIQNAAERRDIGTATGCMLLFRAIGGAFGATLAVTALLAFGFPAGFGSCALFAGASIVISAVMRDSLLRS
jgi:EmrB/QacA subfamily drug resistance transporter